MTFHLMLVDAEIEWLPIEAMAGPAPITCCTGGPCAQSIRVLDRNLHRDLLSSMPDSSRRGRPDIVHEFLLMALGSMPRAEGKLDVLVHTRDDFVIRFGRKAKVDKDYIKFLSMIARLFENGVVGMNEWRISMEADQRLPAIIEAEKLDVVIALSPTGKKQDLRAVLSAYQDEEIGIIIGGFPEGDYLSQVYELADSVISLGDELLTVPAVTAQVIAAIP